MAAGLRIHSQEKRESLCPPAQGLHGSSSGHLILTPRAQERLYVASPGLELERGGTCGMRCPEGQGPSTRLRCPGAPPGVLPPPTLEGAPWGGGASQASCPTDIYRKSPAKLFARFPKAQCPPPATSAFWAVWRLSDQSRQGNSLTGPRPSRLFCSWTGHRCAEGMSGAPSRRAPHGTLRGPRLGFGSVG